METWLPSAWERKALFVVQIDCVARSVERAAPTGPLLFARPLPLLTWLPGASIDGCSSDKYETMRAFMKYLPWGTSPR